MVARAFTPSRSMIYGSPERQAASDVAGIGLGILSDLSDLQIEAENRRQISNANIALMKERRALKDYFTEHASEPDKWAQYYQENRQKIYDGVMSGITQPEAKNVVVPQLDEELESWMDWVKDESAKQSGFNTNTDYRLGYKSFEEDQIYSGPEEMLKDLGDAMDYVDKGWNKGVRPVDDLPTEDAVIAAKRDLAQKILSNYTLQAPDAEEILKDPNAYFGIKIKNVLGKDEPIFGPDDIADLKKEYILNKNINNTEIKIAREKKEAEVELEARQFIIKGDFIGAKNIINANLDTLGSDWHTDALNKLKNANTILNDTGVNAYTTTVNPIKFGEIRDKILDGTIKGEKEIRDNVGPDGYSIAQEKYLLDLYNGSESSAKAFEDSAAAQNLKALIKYNIAEEKDEPDIYQFATQRGLGLLQDAITPEMTDREKKEAALRIGRQLEREYEDGMLEEALEKVIKGPLYSKLKPSGFIKPGAKKRILKTATNPKTGERIGWNGTEWIPIQ